MFFFFFFQAEDGIRVVAVTGVQTCALPISLKALSHLPVIVDPSHATGKWELVAPMAKAAIAAGADGLLIEVHSNPECALRSEEHTSELQSRLHIVCRLLLEKKKRKLHNRY